MSAAYLKVDDGYAGGGQWDGGDTSDEVPHLFPVLHLSVPGEGPHDGVDQVAGNVLLQLLKLWQERGRTIIAPGSYLETSTNNGCCYSQCFHWAGTFLWVHTHTYTYTHTHTHTHAHAHTHTGMGKSGCVWL